MATFAGIRSKILLKGTGLLAGEKLELVCKVVKKLNLEPLPEKSWPKKNFDTSKEGGFDELISSIGCTLRIIKSKKSKDFAFLALFTDGRGAYWFKASRGFSTALNESLSSLESLADERSSLNVDGKERLNAVYRLLNGLYD